MEMFEGKKIHHDKDGYEMISVNKAPVRLHRYIWEKHNGPIPKGMVIHHRNFDKTDNRIENLEMMTNVEHASLHAKLKYGDKNPFYGKKHSMKTKLELAFIFAKYLYTLVNKINGYIYGSEMPVVYYEKMLGISGTPFYSMKSDTYTGKKGKMKNIIIHRTLKDG